MLWNELFKNINIYQHCFLIEKVLIKMGSALCKCKIPIAPKGLTGLLHLDCWQPWSSNTAFYWLKFVITSWRKFVVFQSAVSFSMAVFYWLLCHVRKHYRFLLVLPFLTCHKQCNSYGCSNLESKPLKVPCKDFLYSGEGFFLLLKIIEMEVSWYLFFKI